MLCVCMYACIYTVSNTLRTRACSSVCLNLYTLNIKGLPSIMPFHYNGNFYYLFCCLKKKKKKKNVNKKYHNFCDASRNAFRSLKEPRAEMR